MVRIGINGFGRIGRLVLRAALEKKDAALEFVAVNDIADAATNAHLFKYDSNYGIFPGTVKASPDAIEIDGKPIKVLSKKDPKELPWKDLGVQIVVESTGLFTDVEKARLHVEAGAKKVLVTAPAKGDDVTIVMGVNEGSYDAARHTIISNASCTTNCLAPLSKVIDDAFGIKKGLMTTIHAYTNDQKVQDQPHKDLRRARAAAVSMIPTSTGAAKAIGRVIPKLNGTMNGFAMRVPTSTVSVVDLVCDLARPATKEAINDAYKQAAAGALKGILEYCDEPLVSKDFVKNPASCVFDSLSTYVVDGTLAKVIGWYDNEWAYSCRVVDLLTFMAAKGSV